MAPPDTTIVTWLPFYHDMGLMLGVFAPILGGYHAKIMTPVAFLERPARWVQALASNTHAFSASPNFAFELAGRKTSDEDLAGLDLGGVLSIISGSERVYPATLNRFVDRFARFNFGHHMMTPSYGMAEATVYVATRATGGHRRSATSTPRCWQRAPQRGVRPARAARCSVTAYRSLLWSGSSTPTPESSVQRARLARSG